ncbi:nucleolar domain-containing protein [Cyclospora cayetanensis]|uniref:Nucleolar domain-containing protein n=1 Tax=Cyclospora cayetanensis TaxID=88456 RepID=A0A1D3CV02_9EIME|nr:nucleolar domain-containing protein [Cyclospora cayetanensis]
MAGSLDAAIRGVLLQYGRAKEIEKQEVTTDAPDGCGDLEEGVEGMSAAKESEEAVVAATQKGKMLKVARMLVDSNPRIRNKGMASVGSFLESFQELKEDEILRVWSTLYYAAWLSDKPLVQRDFFVRASLLHRRLRCAKAKTLFFCSFFRVLVSEWGNIDKHRTNKFLLFCRIFLAEWMHVMHLMNWEESFTKMAVEFLSDEILLQSNARGVALHLVDVIMDEFRVLLDPETHPAGVDGGNSGAAAGEKQQEERLRAFAWIFVPFLRCCCFSRDGPLVARIHERTLRKLEAQDVDLQFVSAALFSLASDKIGSFSSSSFSSLLLQRVFANLGNEPQQEPCEGSKDLPDTRKRLFLAGESGDSDVFAVAQSEPEVSSGVSTADMDGKRPAVSRKEEKRPKKRRRLQHQQHGQATQMTSPETQAPEGDAPARKAKKSRQKKGKQPNSTEEGQGQTLTDGQAAQGGLRLPIRSSGASNSSNGLPVALEGSDRASVTVRPSLVPPVHMHSEEQTTTSGSDTSGERSGDVAVSAQGSSSACGEQAAEAGSCKAEQGGQNLLRRSLRISEATPGSKRVLFNLKRNKVVAFSRHAPSLAVGPAVSPSVKSAVKSRQSEQSGTQPAAGVQAVGGIPPPRGILRAAKELGPPTGEEVAPMPPIQKSQRAPWWGGTTAELMAILRRALAQRLGTRTDTMGLKSKKKKIKKGAKRTAKHKETTGE